MRRKTLARLTLALGLAVGLLAGPAAQAIEPARATVDRVCHTIPTGVYMSTESPWQRPAPC